MSDATSNQDYILNMDQTPVFFSMAPNTTLNVRGAQTVNVRSLSSLTIRCTVAVTVTASGKMLPPMIIFKGKPGGRIEREFDSYPTGAVYMVQERAWMNEVCMMEWVQRVLSPYIVPL